MSASGLWEENGGLNVTYRNKSVRGRAVEGLRETRQSFPFGTAKGDNGRRYGVFENSPKFTHDPYPAYTILTRTSYARN